MSIVILQIFVFVDRGLSAISTTGCQLLAQFWHISYQFYWAGHIWECNHTAIRARLQGYSVGCELISYQCYWAAVHLGIVLAPTAISSTGLSVAVICPLPSHRHNSYWFYRAGHFVTHLIQLLLLLGCTVHRGPAGLRVLGQVLSMR